MSLAQTIQQAEQGYWHFHWDPSFMQQQSSSDANLKSTEGVNLQLQMLTCNRIQAPLLALLGHQKVSWWQWEGVEALDEGRVGLVIAHRSSSLY